MKREVKVRVSVNVRGKLGSEYEREMRNVSVSLTGK